jgi:hypothetical protein
MCRIMRFIMLFLAGAVAMQAAELKLKTSEAAPPKEVDPSIQKLLQANAVHLLDGEQPAFQFWLVKELPNVKALDTIKPATLLGVAAVSKAQRDYRDDEIAPGVYTMRFTLQPQDGNHLGSADFLTFAVLTPAKIDGKPDGITDYKTLVKASSKETTTDHPVVLSLRPSKGDSIELVEPAPEHKSVRVKIPGSVTFEIVYEGKGHK